ncbi:MAG: chorismate mutase family protein [Rhodobacteraceae bacterium]|nr:MAG: chorismate mutase family protein [Paracoccaceae bacterium]
MPRAENCTTMSELRAEIDRIDQALVALLRERVGCIDRAVTLKQGEGLPARIESRVAEVLAKVRREAERNGVEPELVERLWSDLIEWSIAREERVLGSEAGREER